MPWPINRRNSLPYKVQTSRRRSCNQGLDYLSMCVEMSSDNKPSLVHQYNFYSKSSLWRAALRSRLILVRLRLLGALCEDCGSKFSSGSDLKSRKNRLTFIQLVRSWSRFLTKITAPAPAKYGGYTAPAPQRWCRALFIIFLYTYILLGLHNEMCLNLEINKQTLVAIYNYKRVTNYGKSTN